MAFAFDLNFIFVAERGSSFFYGRRGIEKKFNTAEIYIYDAQSLTL